jgi:hypothetical protein
MNENDTWIDPAITVEASENQNSILAKVAAAFETVKTHTKANAKTILLGLSVSLVQPAMPGDANAALRYSQPSMSQSEEGEVNKSSIHQTEPITRDTLKGFMNEGLHTQIEDFSDDVLGYLSPIIERVLGLDDEWKQGFIARWMIATFLAPDVSNFERATSMFERVGLVMDQSVLDTARIYLEAEQYKINRENGILIIAMATQDEIIAKQQRDYDKIEEIIAELKANTAETDADTAKLKANTAETDADTVKLKANTAKLKANTAKLDADTAELNAQIARLRLLQWEITQNIEDIKSRWTQSPA